jgi:hypothetical protein
LHNSNGSLLLMYGGGGTPQTASITVDTPADANALFVRVKGEECADPTRPGTSPWPYFSVQVDGTRVISAYATTTSWNTFGGSANVPAGRHTLSITFHNDFKIPYVCNRNLRVDHFILADTRYAIRGVYDRDASATGFDFESAIGFNAIDSGPYKDQMDALAARGLKGFVWLGGYSNTTCAFNQSDDWVRSHVAAVAGNPGVGGYFIDDEPDPVSCPNVAQQIKARSDLVKSIDPGPPTFMVDYKVDRFSLWAGKTDVLGLDHYPCSIKNGCDYSKIDAEAAEADRLGIRYWGVIQAHGDAWYKVPTPDELHQQFVHWRATQMEGYLVFAWHFPDNDPSLWLANNLPLQAQLALENSY